MQNSNLRGGLDQIFNRDYYSNLSYVPKLLQLSSGLIEYPRLVATSNLETVNYTNIDDIEPQIHLASSTEHAQVMADRQIRTSYHQEIDTIQYSESEYQKSASDEVVSKVLRRLNIDLEKKIWHGDSLENKGFKNNPFTQILNLGTLTTSQELYQAILFYYLTYSNNLKADLDTTVIVMSMTTKTLLSTPSGSTEVVASFYTRLINEVLGGDPNRIVVVPDFIFTDTGDSATFFGIIEKNLSKIDVTAFPEVLFTGSYALSRTWIFGSWPVNVILSEKNAMTIYEYDFAPAVTKSFKAVVKKSGGSPEKIVSKKEQKELDKKNKELENIQKKIDDKQKELEEIKEEVKA